MRTLAALSLALATLIGATTAHAVTPRGAKPVIVAAIQRSSKVMDKQGPFHTKLLGTTKAGLREFRASNMRNITIPGNAPAGAQGGTRLTVGGMLTGTINMKTNRVYIKSVSMAKSMPSRSL